MSKRLVIALGGNALGKTPQEQLDLVKGTASTIVDLVEEGYDVVIGHGNGPQVGMVNLAFEYSANNGGGTPAMPFPECGAMTQGYIGYHLQQAVERELARRGINKPCAAVVTQVRPTISLWPTLIPPSPIIGPQPLTTLLSHPSSIPVALLSIPHNPHDTLSLWAMPTPTSAPQPTASTSFLSFPFP